MKFIGKTNEYFEMLHLNGDHALISDHPDQNLLSAIWFEEDDNHLIIDAKSYVFKKNQIVCLTGFHKVEFEQINKAKYLRFNSPFYCILDHDSEVGCKGILFLGSKSLPILDPKPEDLEILSAVWQMALVEMKSKDNLQLEMLQMMLKRLLILFARIYKSQENFDKIDNAQSDLVREFNFLVEMHFKEKHAVADYAKLLNKSPKTLSNVFGKLSKASPIQLIQNRIMLEVRRLLRYTDMTVSEIGYEVGFNDVQSFSRFFKKNEGISPSEFRLS